MLYLKSTSPKEYWNISYSRNDSLDILHEHFAILNAAAHDSNDIYQSHVTVTPDPIQLG